MRLDREVVVIPVRRGSRSHRNRAFGLSPSRHELMAPDIEQVLRAAGAAAVVRNTGTKALAHFTKPV